MADYELILYAEFTFARHMASTSGTKLESVSVVSATPVTLDSGDGTPIDHEIACGKAIIPPGDTKLRVVSVISSSPIPLDSGSGSLILHEMTYDRSLIHIIEFDDNFKVGDFYSINGETAVQFDETITNTPSLEVNGLRAEIVFDDEIPISDELVHSRFLKDNIKVTDSLFIRLIRPDYSSAVAGTQFFVGSEVPVGGITIAPFKKYSNPTLLAFVGVTDDYDIEQYRGGELIHAEDNIDGGSVPSGEEIERTYLPDGNLPDFTSVSGASGQYAITNLSPGVYVLVSTAKGYTVGWKKFNVDGIKDANLWIYPLNRYESIERIYNLKGHSYKLYTVMDIVTDDNQRIIDGLLLFGDIYCEGDPNAISTPSDGWLSLDTDYSTGTLRLMKMPDLGLTGFFEATRGEKVKQASSTRIEWTSVIGPREFDGLCFRVITDPSRTVVLSLGLVTDGIRVTPPAGGGGAGGGTGGGGGSSGSGGGSGYGAYSPTVTSSWGGEPLPAGGGASAVLPPWSPLFIRSVSDKVTIGEASLDTTVIRGGVRYRQLGLTDSVMVEDVKGFPPRLSFIGILLDDNEDPIPNATIVVKAVVNDVIMGYATTDATGLYMLPNVESELEYYVMVCPTPESGYRSLVTTITVNDKDIVDTRALIYFDSDTIRDIGGQFYTEGRLVLPPLQMSSLTDRLIYGIVRDTATRESLVGVIVEIYRGYLNETDDLSPATLAYSAFSGQDPLFDDGYYEIYVPQGLYTIRATRNGYSVSTLYHVNVGDSGARRDIEIDSIGVSGVVYDASEFEVSSIKIPLVGATLTVRDSGGSVYTAVSGANGEFNVPYPAGVGASFTLIAWANGYASSSRESVIDESGRSVVFQMGLYKSELYPPMGR